MDTGKCKVLFAVLETRNITEASKTLGYTPSGVSRIIESLEKELGFPLLIRSHDGVQPTSDCLSLLPMFQEMTAIDKAIKESSQNILGMKQGTVRIGNAYTAYVPSILDAIADFRKAYPQISLSVKEGLSSKLIDDLQMNELDLCICSKRPGNYDWIPLFEDQMVVMVGQNHPLADASCYPVKRFETDPFIDFCPDADTDASRSLKKWGVKPNTQFIATDNYSAYLLVKSGMGVTLTNTMHTRIWSEGVVLLPPDPPEVISVGIAVTNKQYLSPSVKLFLDRYDRVLRNN